jgi:glycosyltransferase involved in cell wall biosynthesis
MSEQQEPTPKVNLDFDLSMNQEQPLVTVGVINCNRLHYLKSCLESFLDCTEDYEHKEVIVVDNASTEVGTEEYLLDLESRGHTVVRMTARDPSNEFARGLNTITRESSGKYVVMLQGDMQFIVKGQWLSEYVKLYAENPGIGCITFDAQRDVTNQRARLTSPGTVPDGSYIFVADLSRPPTSGAADVMYSRDVLNMLGYWEEKNDQHEYTGDSETKMLNRIKALKEEHPDLPWATVMPLYPVAVSIYTDSRGTNARVRDFRRYGDYWAPLEGYMYYGVTDYDDVISLESYSERVMPYSIEEVTIAAGEWSLPKDKDGAWLKNPIRPEEAKEGEWTELPQPAGQPQEVTASLPEENKESAPDYLNEWLDD